ncbi:MAG: tRNA (adenosine(37)-N6)-threonylcarbamoyltransferase complex dimerization subunit type 1 TsaB [Paludibacteraceae bacterium]|nr:tRNA (adenosine(37)-N6)-threonylcarbamoyltransferase complex dimerization subunit type 1 TsaB [Paludibacteraceae bacterium]
MVILAIDTSTSACSVALCDGAKVVASDKVSPCPNHAAALPVMVEKILSLPQAQSVEAVALSEGPGSYTGLRISAAFAKGLCYGHQWPLLPVSTLEVLCMAAKEACPTIEEDAILCPMIDARRMEVYTALYAAKNLHKIEEVQALVVEDDRFIRPYADRPTYFFGNGAAKCAPLWEVKNAHFIDTIEPDAKVLGALVEQKLSTFEMERSGLSANQLAYYEPFYLKPYIAAPSHIKGLQ